jgi:uncharacterized membrane protein (DUF106 family)
MMGATTALLYQSYKPMLIVLSLVLLIYISMYWLGAFLYYDKTSLLVYTLFTIATLACAGLYWTTIFWVISVIVGVLVVATLGISFVVQSCMNIKMNDKLVNKIFQT